MDEAEKGLIDGWRGATDSDRLAFLRRSFVDPYCIPDRDCRYPDLADSLARAGFRADSKKRPCYLRFGEPSGSPPRASPTTPSKVARKVSPCSPESSPSKVTTWCG